MSVKLKLGFIGGGVNSAVGRAHFVACRLDGLFELKAGVFSRDYETNMDSAEQYGAKAVHSIYDLTDNDLDAVVILTPTPNHYSDVMTCLEIGIPVICEKALASNTDQSEALIRKKLEKNSFLAVTYNYTGFPMVRELSNLVRFGALGTIHSIHVEMPQEGYLIEGAHPQDWRLSDGKIPSVHLDLGTHLHHLIHYVTGDFPTVVMGMNNSYSSFGVIDDVNCLAKYSSGFSVNMWFGKTSLGHRNGLKILVNGSKASAEWVQSNSEELMIATSKGHRSILDRASPDCRIANQPRYQRFKAGHPAGFIEAYANLYADLAEGLINKEVPESYIPEIAHNGLQMMECLSEGHEEKSNEQPE